MHDLPALDLNLLRALDALLAERHVTRAAARLGITQSAASHALARLRDELGDPLLIRGPRGTMLPTARAEHLAGPLHAALTALATAVRAPEPFDPTTAKRTFHVGASDYAELVLLPKLAARLRRAPGIELWVHSFTDDGNDQLATGAFDVVLSPPLGAARPAGYFERALFTESFTTLLRAGHPLADERLTLARYCSLPHLMVAPRGTPGSFVDTALRAVGRTRHVAMAVPHFLIVPHVIATSDMVATLATRVAAMFADAHGLVQKPPPIDLPGFTIGLAWHERTHHDLGARWLRDELAAIARAASGRTSSSTSRAAS